jgi:hypothetical protein
VRNQLHVRVGSFFQALLDLRSEPSVVLGAFYIIPHEVAQQLRAGPVIGARGFRERLFQFVIHTEAKGSFRHGLKPLHADALTMKLRRPTHGKLRRSPTQGIAQIDTSATPVHLRRRRRIEAALPQQC